ncbi:hypothetical protein [Achromobacter aegrifaciens]
MKDSLPLTRALLRSRAHELMVYLRFLQIALEKDARVNARGGQLTLSLDKSLTHMMKANVCLLLYSAMEACMVQLLDEIHDAIGQNCKGADQLNTQLVLMVARHFKTSKVGPTSANTNTPLHEYLFRAWLEDWKARDQKEKREAGLSGSVDGLAIFNHLRRFGVFHEGEKKPPPKFTHQALQNTKGRRNQLAHGELSFAELGQGLAYGELCQDAFAVFRTLKRIGEEVSAFLLQRRYMAAPVVVPMEA